FIKSCRAFRFAENIKHAVIADAVARAKIKVRVVIKRAPANTTRILRIRSQLIVHTRMADRVLTLARILVNSLCRIGMPYKLRVQITRMVRRLQWPAEI